MSKVIIQNKRGKITIVNKLSYPETVNERICTAIASGVFESFLPVTIKQKRKETRIECNVQGLLTLNQYFKGLVSKKMFLDFTYQIALIIKSCEKNTISSNNLDLQKDRVFIDPITKKVKCIFWPVVNNQRSEPPHMFLKQLPYDISFNPYEENSYLEQYAEFFNGYNPFSINSFERLLLELQGKKTSGGSCTPSETLSPEKKNKESIQPKDNIEYDPFMNVRKNPPIERIHQQSSNDIVFCTSCGAKNLKEANYCSTCGKKIMLPDYVTQTPSSFSNAGFMEHGTMVLGDNNGGTVVLGFDEPDRPLCPTLLRIKTDKKIAVNKPVFKIGTEQAYCDLFISDNDFISHNHANIITKNSRYFIVDNNSTNKTSVDGKVIPKETEVEIFNGTQIRLANEDFTFFLQ